jgi:hypothetical protein
MEVTESSSTTHKTHTGVGDGNLAQVGREVFIKAVAQILPIYIMEVFKLPFSVCDELNKASP